MIKIAMSSSGLTGLIPTNAPYHPRYATLVPIPQQEAAQRSRTLSFWVDLIAPNNLWSHSPVGQFPYYEVVLPSVFRVGLQPNADMLIDRQIICVAEQDRKIFEYVIVGNADSYEGLRAPFNEENVAERAVIEQLAGNDEIIGFWYRNQNTNLVDSRRIEQADF